MTKHQPWKTKYRQGPEYTRSLLNERWNMKVSSEFRIGNPPTPGHQLRPPPFLNSHETSDFQSIAALAGSS